MAIDRLLSCCISLFIVIHGITRSVASQPPRDTLFGVSPQDENYYRGLFSSSSIKCKDGSKKFDKSQLNDDFCDCPDGSDEPGTSACPNGKFYCRNAGHTPIILYSSRVNDGICDCCDGSDEYDGRTKCPNTCWEAGKVAREKLRKKIATYKEGIAMRKKEIEQAKTAITKDEGDLLKLKDEEKTLKPLVEKLKERKEQIEKAEEEERKRKEKEEKERMEAQEAKEKEVKVEDIEHLPSDVLDIAGKKDQIQEDLKEDSHESVHEPELVDHSTNEELPHDEVGEAYKDSHQNVEQAGHSTDDNKAGLDTSIQDANTAEGSDSLSREELGRRVASRWTGEKTEPGKEESDASSDKDNQNLDGMQNETNDEEDNGYHTEDDEHKYDDVDDDDDDSYDQADNLSRDDQYDSSSSRNIESDGESDFTDTTTASSLSWVEKLQKKVKNMFQAVNLFQTPVNVSDAAHVRKEYDEASAKLSKIQSRISKLTQKLGQDFGPEKEFYSFYGQCFESKQNKYVYKVCPFKQATQEEGYTTTRLGSWAKFEDSYRSMQFSSGDKCWNGPDRSLKVTLRCGLKNELTDVDEPSRCEYLARLGTPALCMESKLKELEEKLEGVNENEPKAEGHDEL